MIDDDDDIPQIDGKIINGTYSTNTPKIKASKLRLLRHHETVGCLSRVALLPTVPLLVCLALGWTIAAVLFGVLTVAAWGFVYFITTRIAELAENAVLTASVVESTSPLRILAVVNMSNGMSDDEPTALKLVQFARIPCHAATLGDVIPCVSGFSEPSEEEEDEYFDRWKDFSPEPLSFSTGDMNALENNIRLLDRDDIELLRRHIREGNYPKEPGELQWLAE